MPCVCTLTVFSVHRRYLDVVPLRVQCICNVSGTPQRVGVLLAEHPFLHLESVSR